MCVSAASMRLRRIARDSAKDHPTVIDVLSAFIREHGREQWPVPHDDTDQAPPRSTRPDVQAAVTVVGRRDTKHDIRPIDLSHAVLIEADLTGADLTGADLTRADLTRAAFTRADLTDVRLIRADFTRAAIYNADFTGADLTGAVVTDAKWSADRADRQAPEGWELDAGSGRLRRAGIGSEPAEAS
jgi:Pentapeptide repeats (8 copies)